MKVLSVFGTRPEAIKMAPLVNLLADTPGIESVVAVTAQHREMLDQVLHLFQIEPKYDLNLMRHGQTLSDITSAVLQGLHPIYDLEQPDLLLVHGDTTTTFAAALSAYYHQVPCGHVEAGLRSFDKYAPYPEEANRCLTAVLADWHFAPTEGARRNLLSENIPEEKIFVTGNTVIDALQQAVRKPCSLEGLGLEKVDWNSRVILLTCHRRENWGEPMRDIFLAVHDLVETYPDIQVVFPMHRNPRVREAASKWLVHPRIILTEPLDYLPFSHVISRCHFLLTDSGGLQEEGPSLGKPVLVLREVTERPEAVAAGTALLSGTNRENIFRDCSRLLDDRQAYRKMATAANPYGDGHAAERIISIIKDRFQE